MTWTDISLYQFQEVDKINNSKLDDLDKILWTTCIVMKLTEHQLDTMNPKKAGRLMEKVSKLFSSEPIPKPYKRAGKYFIDYDPGKLCLGQYTEVSYFLQGNIISNAHYILSSITHEFLRKNKSSQHKKKADYFLSLPITRTIGSVMLFIEKFRDFNNEYRSLFGLGNEETEVHKFNKVYGWQYSAREVAKDSGITLDEAYKLPIREALSSLAYLKSKGEYEQWSIKKQSNGR